MKNLTDQDLESLYPDIQWRSPVEIKITGPKKISGLGCRLCIALRGVHAKDVETLPQTLAEFDRHMAECHGEAIKPEQENYYKETNSLGAQRCKQAQARCDKGHELFNNADCVVCFYEDEIKTARASISALMEALEPYVTHGDLTTNSAWQRAKRVYEQVKKDME